MLWPWAYEACICAFVADEISIDTPFNEFDRAAQSRKKVGIDSVAMSRKPAT
jgi:hypothetical protein